MAAKRNLKPERPDERDERDVEEADQEEWQSLAQDELDRTDGRDHDLLQRSDFPLAHHGKCRERDDQDQREAANDAGHEEPAAAQAGVVPGPSVEFDRWASVRAIAARCARCGPFGTAAAKPSAICVT